MWNYELSPKQEKVMALSLVLFGLLIVFGVNGYIEVMSRVIGPYTMQQKVDEITAGNTNPLEKLHSIADWTKENLKYDVKNVKYYPRWPFLFFRKSHPSAEWIYFARVGGCEEYAILFQGLAEKAGIETRIVYNSGEDHTWDEVNINGSWWHFESMRVKERRFNDPGSYERPKNMTGSGKQISHVYYLENGKPISVTKRYTDIGRLQVTVTKNGIPVPDTGVRIESHFLKDHHIAYTEPMFAIDALTNDKGEASFELGTNNYTIFVKKGLFFGYKTIFDYELIEGSTPSVLIDLSSMVFVGSRVEIALYLGILILIIELVVLVRVVWKKRDIIQARFSGHTKK